LTESPSGNGFAIGSYYWQLRGRVRQNGWLKMRMYLPKHKKKFVCNGEKFNFWPFEKTWLCMAQVCKMVGVGGLTGVSGAGDGGVGCHHRPIHFLI
jgi:hypothetical protein